MRATLAREQSRTSTEEQQLEQQKFVTINPNQNQLENMSDDSRFDPKSYRAPLQRLRDRKAARKAKRKRGPPPVSAEDKALRQRLATMEAENARLRVSVLVRAAPAVTAAASADDARNLCSTQPRTLHVARCTGATGSRRSERERTKSDNGTQRIEEKQNEEGEKSQTTTECVVGRCER